MNKINRRDFLTAAAAGAAAFAAWSPKTLLASASLESYPIGIFTRPWAQFNLKTTFDAIAEAGFRHVGLMTTRGKDGLVLSMKTSLRAAAKIGKTAEERGLSIIAVYGGDFDASTSPQAGISGLHKLIDNVAECRGKTLILGGTGDPAISETYYEAVAANCDYARQHEVQLALKPHGGLNATGPQCRDLINKINHASFRLWYDPGNIYYYSDGTLDPVEDAKTVAGIVTGMCVKDFRPPKEVALTPGDGQVNFPQVMRALAAGGFTGGPLVIECLQDGDLPQLLSQARRAYRFVEELVKSI